MAQEVNERTVAKCETCFVQELFAFENFQLAQYSFSYTKMLHNEKKLIMVLSSII